MSSVSDEVVLGHTDVVARFGEPVGQATSGLVFPATDVVLSPNPMGSMPSCVLIRLTNGTLWMARARGVAWTAHRIVRLSEVLVERGISSRSRETRHTLAAALGIPGMELLTLHLDPIDPDQWLIDEIARALVQRGHRRGARGATAKVHAVRAVAGALEAQLSEAVDKVVAQLEPWGVNAARVARSLDVRLYNFFVVGPVPKYRLQFAKTFPLLIKVAVADGAHEDGAAIRALVDGGTSMIDGLQRIWGVRPAVIRALVGRTPDLVGHQWETNPRALAEALDRLDREYWPGTDPHQWAGFNRAQDLWTRASRAEPVLRALVLEWVRHAGSARWSEESVSVLERRLLQPARGLVATLKKAFLSACTGTAIVPEDSTPTIEAQFASSIDRYLASLSEARLVDLAERFQDNFSRITGESSRELELLEGRAFLPLFPGRFTSSDKSRYLIPLRSEEALAQAGKALSVCLVESKTITYYARHCAAGKCFLVAVTDAVTQKALSLIEVALKPGDSDFFPVIVQHRTHRDEQPAAACRRAAAELLLLCRTEAVQKHLRTGLAVLAEIEERKRSGALRAAHQRIMENALRATLGAETYKRLISENSG